MQVIRTASALQHRAKFSRQALHLADLLNITPELAADQELDTRLAIIKAISRALKVEIERGRSATWYYDRNRHINLCAALKDEMDALKQRSSKLSIDDLIVANSVIEQIAA